MRYDMWETKVRNWAHGVEWNMASGLQLILGEMGHLFLSTEICIILFLIWALSFS